VLRLKYKHLSPERPLSNLYTAYRTVFTPLSKVSIHAYDISWETHRPPTALFITFVK